MRTVSWIALAWFASVSSAAANDVATVLADVRKSDAELHDATQRILRLRTELYDAIGRKNLTGLSSRLKALQQRSDLDAAARRRLADAERELNRLLSSTTALEQKWNAAVRSARLGRGRASGGSAPDKAAAQSELDSSSARRSSMTSLVALAAATADEQRETWRAFYDRFDALGAGLGSAGSSMVQEMARMNMQFLALQKAMDEESRKFEALANAAKARHEAALNAIRNMKS